jgi:exodeoxyribonuclease VII small subunit
VDSRRQELMTDENYTFEQTKARLDEILVEVRKKDTSLEKSIELLEEGVRLANRCNELIDRTGWEPAASEGEPGEGAPSDETPAEVPAPATPGEAAAEAAEAGAGEVPVPAEVVEIEQTVDVIETEDGEVAVIDTIEVVETADGDVAVVETVDVVEFEVEQGWDEGDEGAPEDDERA